jgi:hypothetical protein
LVLDPVGVLWPLLGGLNLREAGRDSSPGGL